MAMAKTAMLVTTCPHEVAQLATWADKIRGFGLFPTKAQLLKLGKTVDGGKVEFIGAGVSKVAVGICKRHVLKVNQGNWDQINPEIEFYRQAVPALRARLAPIEFADPAHKFVVAGRCQPWNNALQTPAMVADRAAMLAAIGDIKGHGLGDLHGGNIGVFDGHVVVLDYGVNGVAKGKGRSDPWAQPNGGHACFTDKAEKCACLRCKGKGLGFHKGRGDGQKGQIAVMVARVSLARKVRNGEVVQCWTGKLACKCAHCAVNAVLGKRWDIVDGDIAVQCHQCANPHTQRTRGHGHARKAG
jgi:hypothetical protein